MMIGPRSLALQLVFEYMYATLSAGGVPVWALLSAALP